MKRLREEIGITFVQSMRVFWKYIALHLFDVSLYELEESGAWYLFSV